MKGRIVKGIAGFYYVYLDNKGLYECKAKGAFRKDHIKPLVGDLVEIDILSEEKHEGNINEIYDRKNALIRPEVANIDQALIVFAMKKPNPNFMVLDKLLLQYQMQNIPVIIDFNKIDLVDESEIERVKDIYNKSGCKVIFTCAKDEASREMVNELLKGKTTSISGPSGVGKSSLVNMLKSREVMETGNISRKLDRGKHTTRHSEIIRIDDDTYIMDTPGFTSFEITGIDAIELEQYYYEFEEYRDCYYKPCSHSHEPDCGVKKALSEGLINQERYNNYIQIFEEIKSKRRY